MSNKVPSYRYLADFQSKILWKHADQSLPELQEIVIDSACTFPLQIGTVMGKIATTGLYAPYDKDNIDGTEVALGLLNETVNADQLNATVFNVQSIMGIRGTAYEASCVGLDATAKALLPNLIFV